MRVYVFLTGASKGIGRACAIALSQHSSITKLYMCLLARNEEGLNDTCRFVHENTGASIAKDIMIEASIHPIDLSDLEKLDERIQEIFDQVSEDAASGGNNLMDEYDHFILINNAGSLGHLGKASALPSPNDLLQNVQLNVVSSCWLSSYFIRWFHKMAKTKEKDHGNIESKMKCTVVNMSSLCAISPFPTMAMYCAGKAYRDMYHQTMAMEEGTKTKPTSEDNIVGSQHHHVKILNYAPGAVATDMTETLSQSEVLDSDLSTFFRERDEATFVKVDDTSKKLVDLVLTDEFESGKHIDFWDKV